MDRDHVRPRLEEALDVELRLLDHQMAVERQPAVRAAGLDDGRTDGEVGDEVAVHDVEVEEVRAGLDRGDLFSEFAEVGG